MIHYDDYNLQLIEQEIRHCYVRKDYKQVECLLRVRKEMLNEQAMSHQEELLPDIIAFNDALRDALKVMYDRALSLYQQVSAIQPNIELDAKCFLDYNYPKTHPYDSKLLYHRQILPDDARKGQQVGSDSGFGGSV